MMFRPRFLSVFVVFLVLVPIVSGQEVPRDFYAEVSKGNIPGHSIERLSGINPSVGVNYEDIISPGGNYVFPTVAVLVNVSSSDADDTDGGTGAWNVTVEGLAANWTVISETIQLNGTVNVTSVNSYIRINRLYTRQAGASEWNEGTIDLTSGAMLLSEIIPNHGQDQYAIYSVPVNCSIIPFSGLITSSEDKTVEVELQTRAYGESWITTVEVFSYRSNSIFDIKGFNLIPEMTDIKIRGEVGATTGQIGTTMNMLCITTDVLNNSTLTWGDGSAGEVVVKTPTNNFLLYLLIILGVLALLAYGRKR